MDGGVGGGLRFLNFECLGCVFHCSSGPREHWSVGSVGCLLFFLDWICPLSLVRNCPCYCLHVVGDSVLEARGRCHPPQLSHQPGTPALLCFLGCSQGDLIRRVGMDGACERYCFSFLVLPEGNAPKSWSRCEEGYGEELGSD